MLSTTHKGLNVPDDDALDRRRRSAIHTDEKILEVFPFIHVCVCSNQNGLFLRKESL